MNGTELLALRQGDSGCPSDLALDRLHAAELPTGEARQLATHIADCPTCPARMAARTAGFDPIADVDPRLLLAGIRRRLAEEPPVTSRSYWRRLALLLVPLSTAAAAALLFLLVKPPTPTPRPGAEVFDEATTRQKGGLGLHVYRLVDNRSSEALSGDAFKSGERLRFVVDLPREGQVAIVGVDARGQLYSAWPTAATPVTTRLGAGRAQELPGAVALDDSPGPETLYLVHCPPQGPAPQCQAAGIDKSPHCADSCSLAAFRINKAR